MIGETIREFEIVSELGAGGYGAVYRAHDRSVNRDVAIKVILPQFADNPDFKQRFESEAQTVARLESPRIVPLYQYWQDERGAFLVMRLIRGGSLRRIMQKQEALSLPQVIRIMSDIAEALAVAHEYNVVHRDLKPENILVDERGNAYLTDFGIAKQTQDADSITEADAIVGTWAYLSPEQIQSSGVSPQSDIYAFGLLLYELLAGKHPFQGVPAPMMVMKHMSEPVPDLTDARPDLPYALNEIIDRATAKDPSDRYDSTMDIIAELKMAANQSNAQPVAPVVMPQRKKPTSPEARNRQAMLDNVRSFWVEGVLENSLHDAAMLDLGLKAESGAVDNPWDTLLRTPTGDETIVNQNIVEVFDRMNGKLLILGDPGSGKTTTLLTLARELLHRADFDEAHPLPVVFNLASWSENQKPLREWLVDELNSKYQVPRKVGEKWIADEELLLLLDGLDEVANDARDACVEAINTYREEHGFVDVVVCSRIKDYDALQGQLRLKGAIVIQPLDDVQIVQYLDGLGSDVTVVRELITRDAQLRELAESPLMLSIMILAYRGKSASDVPDFDEIEAQRQHLFEVYVNRMYERRVGEHPYSFEAITSYLRLLARGMQQHSLSIFYIEDLQPEWIPEPDAPQKFQHQVRLISAAYLGLLWFLGGILFHAATDATSLLSHIIYSIVWAGVGTTYGYLIASDQILFAPLSTRLLYHSLIGIGFGLSMTLLVLDVYQYMTPIAILAYSLFATTTFGLSIVYIHRGGMLRLRTNPRHIVFTENFKFSLASIDTTSYSIVPLQTLTVVTFALLFFPNSIEFTRNSIIIGLLFGAASSLPLNLIVSGFTTDDVGQRRTPNQGLFLTIRGLLGFMVMISFGLSFYWVGMAPMGLGYSRVLLGFMSFMLMFGIGDTVLSHGGTPILQHLFLRYKLEKIYGIPRNLAAFLDHAASVILLKKVGGGYIFIHRYLLEYFADLGSDQD